MRYRLTIISVIATALAAAGLVFALNQGESSAPELTQPELFPEGGLGLVGAFTATAEARGGALDPTSLARPTSTARPDDATPVPDPTVSGSSQPATGSSPQINLSPGQASPGDQVTVSITGAESGESFEITIDGVPVETSPRSVDSSGNVQIQIKVPEGLSGDSVELVATGSASGSNSTQISITGNHARVSVDPEQPQADESITVSAEGFKAGESVTISVSGEEIGSGFAGQDGTFSMTTGLPELPAAQDEPQTLSIDGAQGSSANTDFVAPRQSAGPGSSGTGNNPESGQQSAGESTGPGDGAGNSAEAKSPTTGAVPTWVYVLIGVMAGWLGILTVWVYRLDRDRESQYRLLRHVISDLAFSKNALPEPDFDKSDDESQAA